MCKSKKELHVTTYAKRNKEELKNKDYVFSLDSDVDTEESMLFKGSVKTCF